MILISLKISEDCPRHSSDKKPFWERVPKWDRNLDPDIIVGRLTPEDEMTVIGSDDFPEEIREKHPNCYQIETPDLAEALVQSYPNHFQFEDIDTSTQ